MKNSLLALLLILVVGCADQPKPCQKIDNQAAKKVILDYFNAITNRDFEGLKNLSTQDYVLIEGGLTWNNDTLIGQIKKMSGARFEYEFRDFEFEADCNGSFVHYRNHGILTIDDTTRMDYDWVESAYLKKINDTLKLHYLHSTVAR